MFFFFEPEENLILPPEETIPAGTLSIDEGFYLLSEENAYLVLD